MDLWAVDSALRPFVRQRLDQLEDAWLQPVPYSTSAARVREWHESHEETRT